MLPLMGRRQALCRLASQLSAGASATRAQRWPADSQAAASETLLADRVQNVAQALHVLIRAGDQSHESTRGSLLAHDVLKWQQRRKYEPGPVDCSQVPAEPLLMSPASLPLALNVCHVQRCAVRSAHSSAGSHRVSDAGRHQGPHDSRPFRRSAPLAQSRINGAVRHSSNDGSSDPDRYSDLHEPTTDAPGRPSHNSPAAWGSRPGSEGGPIRQKAQPAKQQAAFQRSGASRPGPHSMQGNGSLSRPLPPQSQRPPPLNQRSDWWQPTPAHHAGSSPGPPLQPLRRDPFPPLPPREDALLPDDTEIRLVREDKSHEVLTYRKAVREAQRAGLDLIGVALTTQPPVFRLGNADKAAHAARQREKDLRRKEVETRRKHTVKEVRIGPTVAEHDLQVKLKQARGFVEKNYRVKLFVPFRMQQMQDAFAMLNRLRELGNEFAAVANPAVNERVARNTFAIYLSPK